MGANVSRGSFQDQLETNEKSLFRVAVLSAQTGRPPQLWAEVNNIIVFMSLPPLIQVVMISMCNSDVKVVSNAHSNIKMWVDRKKILSMNNVWLWQDAKIV